MVMVDIPEEYTWSLMVYLLEDTNYNRRVSRGQERRIKNMPVSGLKTDSQESHPCVPCHRSLLFLLNLISSCSLYLHLVLSPVEDSCHSIFSIKPGRYSLRLPISRSRMWQFWSTPEARGSLQRLVLRPVKDCWVWPKHKKLIQVHLSWYPLLLSCPVLLQEVSGK